VFDPNRRPVYVAVGMLLLLFFGYLANRQVSGWEEKSGVHHRPLSSNYAERQAQKAQRRREMPAALRKRVWILSGIGFGLLLAGFYLAGR
jgi:hypothetical protein